MFHIPVLLLGFNRPDKIQRLIAALRVSRPRHIIFNVDGPRPKSPSDPELVQQVRDSAEQIDWPCRLECRFHEANQGLMRAVTDAVTYATSQYGTVIVIEDDTIPGPDLVSYLAAMLNQFRERTDIGHISGYNVVPQTELRNSSVQSRLSIYPESFAWATWDRAWKTYDESLEWGISCSLGELSQVTGSLAGAIRWKTNFHDAKAGRIDSWAYRWIASLWSQRMLTLSPNVNLATYAGFDVGTHTRRKPRWRDLPIESISERKPMDLEAEQDQSADRWVGKTVFNESVPGVLDGIATSAALEIIRRKRRSKARFTS